MAALYGELDLANGLPTIDGITEVGVKGLYVICSPHCRYTLFATHTALHVPVQTVSV